MRQHAAADACLCADIDAIGHSHAGKMRKEQSLAIRAIVIRQTHPADDGIRPDDAIAADLAIGVDDRTRRNPASCADDNTGI